MGISEKTTQSVIWFSTVRVHLWVQRVNMGADGEDTGEVLLYSLSSIVYFHIVSDHRAQFNEALSLDFPLFPKCLSSSSLPPSLFPCSPFPLCLFALFRSVLFYLLTALPLPWSQPASPLCVLCSPPGGLSHRGRHSKRRFRLWVCRGNAAV